MEENVLVYCLHFLGRTAWWGAGFYGFGLLERSLIHNKDHWDCTWVDIIIGILTNVINFILMNHRKHAEFFRTKAECIIQRSE